MINDSNQVRFIEFIISHPDCIGAVHEFAICDAIGGTPSRNDEYDIVSRNGKKIEVKYAALRPKNSKHPGKTLRWNWDKITGISKNKSFDFLILVGGINQENREKYPLEKYVYFILPFENIRSFLRKQKKAYRIYLLANSKKKSSNRAMYEFQKTLADIKQILL